MRRSFTLNLARSLDAAGMSAALDEHAKAYGWRRTSVLDFRRIDHRVTFTADWPDLLAIGADIADFGRRLKSDVPIDRAALTLYHQAAVRLLTDAHERDQAISDKGRQFADDLSLARRIADALNDLSDEKKRELPYFVDVDDWFVLQRLLRLPQKILDDLSQPCEAGPDGEQTAVTAYRNWSGIKAPIGLTRLLARDVALYGGTLVKVKTSGGKWYACEGFTDFSEGAEIFELSDAITEVAARGHVDDGYGVKFYPVDAFYPADDDDVRSAEPSPEKAAPAEIESRTVTKRVGNIEHEETIRYRPSASSPILIDSDPEPWAPVRLTLRRGAPSQVWLVAKQGPYEQSIMALSTNETGIAAELIAIAPDRNPGLELNKTKFGHFISVKVGLGSIHDLNKGDIDVG